MWLHGVANKKELDKLIHGSLQNFSGDACMKVNYE